MRTSKPLSRLISLAALVVAVMGCEADDARTPGSRLASPVTPTALQVSISTDRSSLRAGTTSFAVISWTATNVPQGTPVPNGTVAAVSTTLGSLNSLGGGTSTQIEMFGGSGSVRLYAPTTGTGIARVRVEIDGVVAVVQITITAPAGPPVPAPTAATITLGADTLIVVDDDSSVDILLTATVLGSNASPFNNAPVQMSSPTGSFDTSASSTSDILATASDGTASDTLNVDGTLLTEINSFTVTATLFTEGGGTKTATVTITVVHADDPPVAVSVSIIAVTPDATMQRNSGSQDATIQARVLNQYGLPFAGENVTFTTGLGVLSGGSVAANIDESDADGLVSVDLDVSQVDLDNFAPSSFVVSAGITADPTGNNATITVTGSGAAVLVPTNVTLFSDFNFVEDDLDAVDEVLNLTALVTDQNGDPLNGVNVTFSDSFGTLPVPSTDGTGTTNPGEAESVLTLDDLDIRNFASNSFTVTATITTPGGTDTSTLTINVIRPPLASFVPIPVACGVGDSRYNFDNTSTFGPGTTWAWDFDVANAPAVNDTSFEPPTQNMTLYLCGGGGSCEISLTATNAAGSSTTSHTVPVPCP